MTRAAPFEWSAQKPELHVGEARLSLFWIGLLVIAAAGALLGLTYFGAPLDIDEPYSANLVHLSLPEVLEFHQAVGYEITFHVLLKLWTMVFGESELALRSMSLLFYCLSIVVVGVTGRQFLGWKAGLMAAALLLTSTSLGLAYAAIARPYAVLLFLVSAAMWLALNIMRVPPLGADGPPDPRRFLTRRELLWCALLVLVHELGLMNHTIYVFFIGAITLAGLFVSPRALVLMVICSGASGLLHFALWWHALSVMFAQPATTWMGRPDLTTLKDAYSSLFGGRKSLLLLAVVGVLLVLQRRRGIAAATSKVGLVVLVTFAAASLVPFLLSQFRPVFNPLRIGTIFLPSACLLVALLISRLAAQRVAGLVTAGFVFISFIEPVQNALVPEDVPARSSMEYVVNHADCGDTFVLTGISVTEVIYYLRYFDAPDCYKLETFPLDTMDHQGWIDIPGLLAQKEAVMAEAASSAERLENEPRVWFFKSYIYEEPITVLLQNELDQRMTLAENLDLKGAGFESIRVYEPVS